MTPPPVLSDEDLVRRLAAGQQEAFGRLYRRYASRLFGMAAHALDRGTAEEIVQDVFMAVWRGAAVFTPERGTFRAWVLQIAHFRILNELRRRRRRPQPLPDPDGVVLASLPDDGLPPEDSAVRESLRPVIRSACEELPRSQRQAVELAFFKDLTHREAATEVGIPLGTFKTHVRTAVRQLRGKLAHVV
jgi:RNA polymerase sigma-70 factor, ECF subfamily